jgi:methylase of polypeptide subunit release factors
LQPTDTAASALLQLLKALESAGYDFMPVTPQTHRVVIAREDKQRARTLRDIFGWSLPFERDFLPPTMLEALEAAGMVRETDVGLLESKVRVGRICGKLILHSAFPTEAEESVFFSPDTHRFVAFVQRELAYGGSVRSLVDIGAGPGTGALCAAHLAPEARLILCDINPLALQFAEVNARAAGLDVEIVLGGIEAVEPGFDLAIANPPFMIDESGRTYRDGGDLHGGALSIEWAEGALARLAPGGRLLLYTGAAIVDGRDAIRERLEQLAARLGCTMRYGEIDPDIYGEELAKPAYADVERIAAVGAVIEKGA